MASDVQKLVEIAFRLTGVDPKQVTPLVTAFQNLETNVKKTQTSVGNLQKKLSSLKTPAALTSLSKSLTDLAKVKLKDLGPLATNLTKLSKLGTFPNIGTFVNNLQKLSSTSFAGLQGLTKQFQALISLNVASVVTKLRDFNTALATLEKRGGLASFAKFASDIRQMKTALDSSQGSVKKMSDSIKDVGNAADQGGVKIRSFGDKIKTVFEFRLISEGLMQLREAISGGVTAIIEYDQALKDLQAITGATNLEVAQMGAKILEVANLTKFSAEEVAAGMRTLGQAGFSAAEAVQTMQSVSDLATGTLSDMSQTVDLMTTAMRVFQIDASESAKVSDTFANAVNRSKLTIEKLRTSMNYVGPVAHNTNITFQETSAAMMTLANAGLRASTIGTSLRQVLAQLAAPSKKFRNAAREAGVAMQDLDPTTNSLSTVLANLRLVVQDTGVAFDIFGKRGASAAVALTNQNSQYDELFDTVSKTGTAAEMAAKQMEGLGVSFKNLRDKLGNLAIAIGKSGLSQVMKVFVDIARVLVDVLNMLASTVTGRVIIALTVLSATIFAVTGAFIALKTAIVGSAVAAFTVSVIASTKALLGFSGAAVAANIALGPIGWAIAAISVAAYIMYQALSDGSDDAIESANNLADEYGNLAKRVKDYQVETVNMKEGSKELEAASLGLRKELSEVAQGSGEVAEKAARARDQINPLTGEILDHGKALEEYRQTLNRFSAENLVKALQEANTALEEQISLFARWRSYLIQFYGVNVAGIFKQIGAGIEGVLDGSVKKAVEGWNDIGKELDTLGEASKKAFDFTAELDAGTKSFEDLKNMAKELKTVGRPLALLEKQLVERFEAQYEASSKLIEKWQEMGDLELDNTVKHIENLAEKAKLTKEQTEALVSTFKELKEATKGSFETVPEKWAQRSLDFLTKNIDEYKEAAKSLGVTISDLTVQQAEYYENEENKIGQKALALKAEKALLIEQGKWTDENARKHFKKVEALNKEEEELRTKGNAEAEITRLKEYNKEVELHRKKLEKINTLYVDSVTDRNKAEQKQNAAHRKRVKEIMTGSIVDPADQTSKYKENLKEREAAHAAYILKIKQMEADKQITVEESQRRQNAAELAFYAVSLQKAKEYMNQVKKEHDPDEYSKRYKIVLDATEKYYQQKAKLALDSADLLAELEKKEIEGKLSFSEKLHKAALKRQKDAADTLEKEMKAYYEEGILFLNNYYDDRIKLEEADAEKQKGILIKRSQARQEALDLLISASNSEIEITELKNEKLEEELDLKNKLIGVDEDRAQAIARLNTQRTKDEERALKRIEAVQEAITRNKEKAQTENATTSLDDKFLMEKLAVERRHAQEIKVLRDNALSEDHARLLEEQAIKDQRIEMLNLEAEHEKQLYEIRQQAAADYVGNIGSVFEEMYTSGLMRSKKMFKVGQAFAIAEATINAWAAASEARLNIMKTFANVPGAAILANIAFAAELAKGLATVAKIASQQPPSAFAEGGLIGGQSPHSKADNVPIRATAGEYMQPVSAVQKYGLKAMNAIRTLKIPKSALLNLIEGSTAGLNMPRPSFALASGGPVSSAPASTKTISTNEKIENQRQPINIMNVTNPNEIGNYLATPEGTNVLMNIISSKGAVLKRILR